MDARFSNVTVDDAEARATVAPAHARALCDGHFPGDPLLPGACLAELMAALAARLLGVAGPPTAIRRCVFHARVRPSAAIGVAARRAAAGLVEAWVIVDGTRAAQATLVFEPPA